MKFRVYRVETNETITTFEAKDSAEAFKIMNKWYDANDDSVDIEAVTKLFTVRVFNIDHTVFADKLVFATTEREAVTKAMDKVDLSVFVEGEVINS